MKTSYKVLAIVSFVLTTGAVASLSAGQETSQADKLIDSAGNLRMPADYRTAYQFLGTWAVAAD